jgi:hypothetical protein
VIVPPDAFDFWLDAAKVDAETASALIAPAREGLLDLYEVSAAVNRTANDTPALIEPAAAPPAAHAGAAQAADEAVSPRKPKPDSPQGSLF